MLPMTKVHLSIISPAYQNEKYIGQTVKEIYRDVINQANFTTELIIAEDGSTDKTRDILAKLQKKYGFTLITDPKRKGHIKATKELYQKARGELIFFLDSDGECPPKEFWQLYRLLQKERLDLVIGARKKRKPAYRHLIAEVESIIAKVFFNLAVKDPNCPLRIMTKKAARQIIPQSGHLKYNFNFEQLIWAKRLNLAFNQVKINHRKRESILSPPDKILGQTMTAFFDLLEFKLRG
jgi:glycosyltransferase involved in cell wall biosynthesis